MALNKFQCIGNLCSDIEVRQVGQSQVGKVTIALSERFKKNDGTVGEQTEFVSLEMWDKPNLFPHLKKGVLIYAEGSIRNEQWTDQAGNKHTTTKVRVMSVQLLSKPQQETQQPAYQQAPYPPQGQQMPGYAQPPVPPAQTGYQPPVGPAPQAPVMPPASPQYQPAPQYTGTQYPPQAPGDMPF